VPPAYEVTARLLSREAVDDERIKDNRLNRGKNQRISFEKSKLKEETKIRRRPGGGEEKPWLSQAAKVVRALPAIACVKANLEEISVTKVFSDLQETQTEIQKSVRSRHSTWRVARSTAQAEIEKEAVA
jgi:hypothetical protein